MFCEDDRLLPVKIYNVYPFSEALGGITAPQSFLVVLKGDGSKVVPITIGHFEGQALVMALRRIPLPRPLPHHLLQELLEKMDAVVVRLVIHTLQDDVFHARLCIRTEDGVFSLDCRPSDGMILATLLETPVFMSPEVMEEAGRELKLVRAGERRKEPQETSDDAEFATGEAEQSSLPWGEATASMPEQEVPEHTLTELELLNLRLKHLISQEAYEEAARVRDQIRALSGSAQE